MARFGWSGVTRLAALVLAAGWVMAGLARPAAAAEPPILVFAAASTTNALTDIAKAYEQKGLGQVTFSFAASSALARQIEEGAPAQLFLSADTKWMDYLAQRDLIVPATRANLLGNELALIAPRDSKADIAIRPGFDLAGALGGDGRLAVGDPSHVPAGIYARQALEKLGVWDKVRDKLARAASVRAALALVERGEAPFGIVYTTDAAITSKVRVVATFPEDSHPPIVYPVAVVKGQDGKAARSFLSFLSTPGARAIFAHYGFKVRQN